MLFTINAFCLLSPQIFKNNKVYYHIRTSNTTCSNWVHYVTMAAGPEHNLLACQVDLHIYLYTVKPIPPNVELLAWFSRDYADRINCPLASLRSASCSPGKSAQRVMLGWFGMCV